jgi:hypothetical protein
MEKKISVILICVRFQETQRLEGSGPGVRGQGKEKP